MLLPDIFTWRRSLGVGQALSLFIFAWLSFSRAKRHSFDLLCCDIVTCSFDTI